jgi:hypothetical protein
MTSTVVIMLKSSRLNDRDLLSSAISQTLREYLEFVDCGQAGNEPQETYVGKNGTEMYVSAVSSPVADIPHAKPLCSVRRVDADREHK